MQNFGIFIKLLEIKILPRVFGVSIEERLILLILWGEPHSWARPMVYSGTILLQIIFVKR